MHEMKGLGQQPVFSVSLMTFRKRLTGGPDKSLMNPLDSSQTASVSDTSKEKPIPLYTDDKSDGKSMRPT